MVQSEQEASGRKNADTSPGRVICNGVCRLFWTTANIEAWKPDAIAVQNLCHKSETNENNEAHRLVPGAAETSGG